MKMNIKAILGIMLVFALGAASGSLLTYKIEQARLEAFIGGGPGAREEFLVKRLTARLDLDDRQREQVGVIVHETHAAMRQARRQIHPRIEALLEQGQSRISALLRPEQRERFERIIAERKAHRPPEGQ